MRSLGIVGCCLFVVGCAGASTMPLSVDTIQIVARAAPICGAAAAESMAFKQAAAETIKRGFDSFVIVNGQYQADTFVAGYTPIMAQSNGTAVVNGYGNSAIVTGSSSTTVTGGDPIHMTRHSQGIVVKMFKEGDPAGSK